MKIKWYGTASLLIESGGTRILVDPYLKRYNPALPALPVEEAETAEAIFITHPHFDHFCDVGAFLSGSVKNVYVAEAGIAHAQANGIPDGKMIPLASNEKVVVGDITVRTFRGSHCKFDAATVLSVALSPGTYFRFHDAVEILRLTGKYKITDDDICVLEFSAEGKKIIVMGSAGIDVNTEYPDGADLFVLPYQGRSRMHRYVIPILRAFQPKRVMLDHFDNAFPPITRTVKTKKFIPTVKKILPETEAFIPVENEWYEI